MKNLSLFACTIFLFVSTLLADELTVLHGSHRSSFASGNSREVKFDVIEIARGKFHSLKLVSVYYMLSVDEYPPDESSTESSKDEEKDVILLLLPDGPKRLDWSQKPYAPMTAIGFDRKMSILPYSKELWEEIASKSDEELLGKLPTEQEAWKCAYDFAIQKGAHPEYIYASYPKEYRHCQSFMLYLWIDGRLYDISLDVSPLKNIFIQYGFHGIESSKLELDEIDSFLIAVYGKNPNIMPYRLGSDGLPVMGQGEGRTKGVEP